MIRGSEGWWDLSTVWDEIYGLGNKIDLQKKDYTPTKGFNSTHRRYNDAHIIGLVGEYVIELESGVPFDREIKAGGDCGQDFVVNGKTVDVKCSTFVPDPDLKNPVGSGHWADYFILVVFDEREKRARLVGWTTGKSLQNAEVINYGYGPQKSMNWKKLNVGLPPVFTKEKHTLKDWLAEGESEQETRRQAAYKQVETLAERDKTPHNIRVNTTKTPEGFRGHLNRR